MAQYDEYDNPELQSLVSSIGTRLADISERNNLIFRFTLLDSDQVNAFATPGGYIYITRGLLAYLNSEAELAAVLGHEIGHVTARHSVRQQTQSTLAGIAGIGVAVATGSRAAMDLSRLLGAAVVRGYGRKMELESDALGARYLAKTDYTPNAMIDVIGVLKNQEVFEKYRAKEEEREPRVYHGVFASHPKNDTRLQEVIEAANTINPDAPNVNQAEREAFIKKLDGLVFDKPSKEGVTRENSFYHNDLDIAFDFPDNWRVDNQPTHVDLYAPKEKALIRFRMDDLNKKMSPRDFIINSLEVKRFLSEEEFNVGDMQGYSVVSTGATPWKVNRQIRHTVVYRGDKAYIFQAAAKDYDTLKDFDADFKATAESFRRLTDNDRLQAKPQRLKIITVQAGDTIESLAANSPLPVYAAEQIRLLNNLYPDLQPQTGQLLKIVE